MRKELIKAVRKLFEERLRICLPQFVPFKMVEKGAFRLGAECRWYRWQVAPDLAFFLILKPLTKEGDEFWVNVAWSRKEDHSDLADNFDQLFNLGKLWNAPSGWFKWELTEPGYLWLGRLTAEEFAHWAHNVEEEERKRIEAGLIQAPICVDDSIDRIVAYALPFFERIRQEAVNAP
jgi:hypothetical protein